MSGPAGDLRARLLDAAAQLLAEGGVEAVSIRQSARRAGVSHGAPRRYFPTRSHLLASLARAGFVDLSARMDALEDQDPVERLVLAGRAYLDLARARPALLDLMTRHDLLEGSGADLRSASLGAMERWHDLAAAARPGARTQDSLLLFATVHGLATLRARRALEVLGHDPDALLEHLLRTR